MVRTKKHFRPPPPSSSSSSSSSSEEDDEDDDNVNNQVPTGRGKQLGNFGRGKQLNMATAAGRGKQLRAPVPESDEGSSEESSSESEEDDEEEDDDEEPPPPTSRGKQLRPPAIGRGKQLRAPIDTAENEETDSSTSASQTAATATAVVRGGGKQFGRSIGKQLAMQTAPAIDEEDDSDSSSDEEPWAEPIVQRGQGKQLRLPQPTAEANDDEESDMEESEEEEDEKEEDAAVEKTVNEAKPSEAKVTDPPKKDDEEGESDFEPVKEKAPPPKRARGRPPARAAATRAARSTKEAAKKESLPSEEEEEDESEEESVEEDSDESSDEEEQEWDMETFDTQRLVKGEDDKKYLDSLPELERENILAERFEKLKSEADMKKALRENKRKEREEKKALGAKNKKRTRSSSTLSSVKKAMPAKKRGNVKKKVESDSEDDDAPDTSGDVALAQSLAGKRVSARNLDKKGKQFKKQAALAKIRENRANKHAAAEESDSELDYGRDSDDSDDDYEESNMLKPWQQKGKKKQLSESSDDELVGDVVDQQTPTGSAKRRTEDLVAELEDYIKVTVPRRKLILWCNEPFFEKAVRNFYVRLGIGRDKVTQKPCYRLCKITGVVSKNEYSFSPVENQKQVLTDKWLKLSFGKTVKEFKMLTVSDHRPSADEVNQLVTQLKIERLTDSILTKKSAIKLRMRQEELVMNYTYTKEDVDMLVTEKKKRNKKALNIGYEKTRIAIAVQAAQEEVEEATKKLEDAKIERMEADDNMVVIAEASVKKSEKDLEAATRKLEERIEEQQRILKEEQDRVNRMKKSSKIQNWVKVNQRAKLANRNADFESYKEQLAKEQIHGSAEPKFDPYARRRVKPKNLWEVGGPRSNEKASEVINSSGVVEEEKKETTERDDTNVGKSGDADNKREDIPQLQKNTLPGQVNQFTYDDEIMVGGDIANLGGTGAKRIRMRSRKGLSLDEYRERKSSGTL